MEIIELIKYIKQSLSKRDVLAPLAEIIENKTSTAGSSSLEEVFTREFLCPVIADYFYKDVRNSLDLSNSEIESGLGAEGSKNAKGFGFSPARKYHHLFRKSEFFESKPPALWTNTENSDNQASPDFAIRDPLPLSILGEVKYFRKGRPESAVQELYNVARQAVFYLGAFAGEYANALIVVADASSGHAFCEGLKLINPNIMERFGPETSVYLSVIPLH
jgi:hypothetical protein